jgi:hypothetical protein
MSESRMPKDVYANSRHESLLRIGQPVAFGLATVLVSLTISAVLIELGLRLFCRSLDRDERSLLYRYDQRLGWFPKANSHGTFTASRTIHISHNSDGFRGPEYTRSGKPVIVFLGDSFVWGFDAEASERFSEKLQTKHDEWAIYNLGISGYGTDQEYLLLNQVFDKYQPRVVFLVYCVENDDADNCSNFRFGYYKPFCMLEGTRLDLKGIPVPKGSRVFWAEHPVLCRSYIVRLIARAYYAVSAPPRLHNTNPSGPLLRDLQKYVRSKGAILLVGLTRGQYYLEQFLAAFKIPWVDLSTDLRYPGFGSHWTPQGHSFVADRVDAMLSEGKYLERSKE